MNERKDRTQTMERELVVKDIRVHIKSVFCERTTLENALANMIARKFSEKRPAAAL